MKIQPTDIDGTPFIESVVSSTDNAIVRWDGTSGSLVQDSLATIDDSGVITSPLRIQVLDNGVIPSVVWSNGSLSKYGPNATLFYGVRSNAGGPGSAGCIINMARCRGTVDAPEDVVSSDICGQFNFSAYQNGEVLSRAAIVGRVRNVGSPDADGEINFMTRYNGAALSTKITINPQGFLGVGTVSPTAAVDVASDHIRLENSKTPASASDTGNQGDICWDANFIYVCTATNTWKRAALSTW